jgi:hypothetical protein
VRTRHAARVALLALLLAVGVPVVAPRPPAETGWLVDLTLDLDSPDAVATFMLRQFSFRHDRDLYGVPERFATPDELLARGAGDCEDWAWFAAEALREHGYATWLVSVWRQKPDEAGNTGHMVAAYLARDGWGYVSTEGHVAAHAPSIAGLADTVMADWSAVSIWTYSGTPTRPGPWNGWRPSVRLPHGELATPGVASAEWPGLWFRRLEERFRQTDWRRAYQLPRELRGQAALRAGDAQVRLARPPARPTALN